MSQEQDQSVTTSETEWKDGGAESCYIALQKYNFSKKRKSE